MTPHTTFKKPTNIVSFRRNGTACVVFFPYAPELTEAEWERIDAARRIRFFVYACLDAPVPPGHSGVGKFEDFYPTSLRSAINISTCMRSGILPVRQPMRSRQDLVDALLDLDDANGSHEDDRGVVTFVTDRSFVGDDREFYRPVAGA
jgi:hypothetical protein